MSTNLALVLSAVVAVALGLGSVSQASAQASDIQIVELDCNSDPELVVIQNVGDASQDLTGWELQSGLPQNETFDLSGILQPGVSASIILGNESLFRNDDPAEFARIADDTGAVVHQVSCTGEVLPETDLESPDPVLGTSSEPPPLGDVPNGGGPPPPADNILSPGFVILVGASMLAVGAAVLALPRLGSARSPLASRLSAYPPLEPATTSTAAAHREGQPISPKTPWRLSASGIAVAGIAATVAVVVLAWRRQT